MLDVSGLLGKQSYSNARITDDGAVRTILNGT